MKVLLLWKARRISSSRRKRRETFSNTLNEDGRRRRDRNIPRIVLPPPKHAAWKYLYDSGDDGALITVTGFDHATFSFISELFEPYFNCYTP